eukprot:gene16132-3383_t
MHRRYWDALRSHGTGIAGARRAERRRAAAAALVIDREVVIEAEHSNRCRESSEEGA